MPETSPEMHDLVEMPPTRLRKGVIKGLDTPRTYDIRGNINKKESGSNFSVSFFA